MFHVKPGLERAQDADRGYLSRDRMGSILASGKYLFRFEAEHVAFSHVSRETMHGPGRLFRSRSPGL